MNKRNGWERRKRRMDAPENWGWNSGFYQREQSGSGERNERTLEDNIRGQGFYHRLFEGYREELVSGEDGKRKRIVRTYTGNYYQKKCSSCRWILGKALYLFLYLAAAMAYLFALTRPTEGNTVWYTAAPGLLSVIPMMLLFAKVLACAAAKRKMVLYDYKYVFKRLFWFCAVAAGFLCATALMLLLFLILNPQTDFWSELAPCISCLLGAGIILTIGGLERRAEYESIENPNAPLENSGENTALNRPYVL